MYSSRRLWVGPYSNRVGPTWVLGYFEHILGNYGPSILKIIDFSKSSGQNGLRCTIAPKYAQKILVPYRIVSTLFECCPTPVYEKNTIIGNALYPKGIFELGHNCVQCTLCIIVCNENGTIHGSAYYTK